MVRFLSAFLLGNLAEAQDYARLCKQNDCVDSCLAYIHTDMPQCVHHDQGSATVEFCQSEFDGVWCTDDLPEVRLHNIYRCMHGLPSLEWSYDLFRASDAWAKQLQSNNSKQHDLKVDGFDTKTLGQGAIIKYDYAPEGQLLRAIRVWFEEAGEVRDAMLRPSTTHFGCRFLDGNEHGPDKVVCDYGGPPGSVADDEKVPARVKTFDECDKLVDTLIGSDLSPDMKGVTISYQLPDHLMAAADKHPCVHEYRLVLNKYGSLKLIGVDGSGTPCTKHYHDHQLWWEVSKTGIFSKKNDEDGSKICLMADWAPLAGPFNLVTNNAAYSSNAPCTHGNTASDWKEKDTLWNFAQVDVGGNLCMLDVDDADGKNLVIDADLKAANTDRIKMKCSTRWKMTKVFGAPKLEVAHLDPIPSLQGPSVAKTCQECLSSEGTGLFSCATVNGCRLAPTKLDCNTQGGTWCATTMPPSYEDQVCEGDDWEGHSPERRNCSAGCTSDICQQKIDAHPKTAIKHCYTKAQFIDGNTHGVPRGQPRGCDYGSQENTCALDDQNICVYSGSRFAVTV